MVLYEWLMIVYKERLVLNLKNFKFLFWIVFFYSFYICFNYGLCFFFFKGFLVKNMLCVV